MKLLNIGFGNLVQADKIIAIIRAEHAKTRRTIHKYNEILEVK